MPAPGGTRTPGAAVRPRVRPNLARYARAGRPPGAAGKGSSMSDYLAGGWRPPMKGEPPQFRILGSAWFHEPEYEHHRAPVWVVFTIVDMQRRAFIVTRDPDGLLYAAEYHQVDEPETDQTPFAARIDGRADAVIAVVGDPLDAWIVTGRLPSD